MKKIKKSNKCVTDLSFTRIAFLCGLLIFTSFTSTAQKKLSKKEIHDILTTVDNWRYDKIDSLLSVMTPDNALNEKISGVIQWLTLSQIDTLGLFISAFPGSLSADTCDKGEYPLDAYLFWKDKQKMYIQKITRHCIYKMYESGTSSFLDYYTKSKEIILKENLMPVIYEARLDENKRLVYTTSYVSHEPVYTIYCRIKNEYKLVRFSRNDVVDKKSIFYNDNITSPIYKWFKAAEKEISDLDKKLILNKE